MKKKELRDDIELYRIIDFFTFVEILTQRKETYLNPVEFWEDPFEGMQIWKTDEESLKKLYDELKREMPNAEEVVVYGNLFSLVAESSFCYAQSWSFLKDSDAMWRIYNKNNQAIQIVSNKRKINALLLKIPNVTNDSIRIDCVNYFKKASDVPNIKKGNYLNESFFWKRRAFKHEEEVRVFFVDKFKKTEFDKFFRREFFSNNHKINALSNTMSSYLKTNMEETDKNIKKVDINNLDDYILGVRVNPFAEKRFVDLVEKLCLQNNINFIEQSNLYDKAK